MLTKRNYASDAQEVIRTLEDGGFYALCPCCGERIPLRKAGLFHLSNFTAAGRAIYEERLTILREKAKELTKRRQSIKSSSEVGARSVNIGFILERLAPALKAFRFERTDCRSLFDPIDYVIFEGLTKKSRVSRILFADIKTGKAPLKKVQREIKDVVERKRVSWDAYEVEGNS